MFNQPLSFDTFSVTDMRQMFDVRSSPCPTPSLKSEKTCMLHTPQSPAASRLPARTSPGTVCFPFDSAGRKLLVQRQQAAHRLRVGEHHGLPPSLELGFSGKLLAELKPSIDHSSRNLRVAETYIDMKGVGVKKRVRAPQQPIEGCAV